MRVVIIGAGPAGVTVAETLRKYGSEWDIVLVSDEPFPPYAPPAMVEYFLTGNELHYWKGKDFTRRLGIEWHPWTRIEKVDTTSRCVTTVSGSVLNYDKLALCPGSRLYAPLEGVEMPGIYNFKSLTAAESLVEKVRRNEAKSALIVGAGFIGVEIALLLKELGLQVTQIEMTDRVMPKMLDAETAGIVLKIMREKGIDVRLETVARCFDGNGRATGVQIESGETLKADLLIASTGVKPNVEFLRGSGVGVNWGITVDDHLRTTVRDVYAAGDAVETMDRVTSERYVHAIFPNAVAQGELVAYNLMGWDRSYEGSDNMNSLKHLGLPIMAAGQSQGEEMKIQHDGMIRKIYLKDDRIVGFRLVGDVRMGGMLRSLMNRHANVNQLRHNLTESSFSYGILAILANTIDLAA